MHKAELVLCRCEIDVSGLVTSQEEDMIFRLTLKSMGKNRQLFKKTLISQGYTYKYILKLWKAQEKTLDKILDYSREAGVAQQLCNGLPRNGSGFDSQ